MPEPENEIGKSEAPSVNRIRTRQAKPRYSYHIKWVTTSWTHSMIWMILYVISFSLYPQNATFEVRGPQFIKIVIYSSMTMGLG